MRKHMRAGVVIAVVIGAIAVAASVRRGGGEQIVSRDGYSVPCHIEQGGSKIVAEDGCELELQSGASLDLQSGASAAFSGSVTGAVSNTLAGAALKLDPGGNTSLQATANYYPILTLGGTPTASSLKIVNSASTEVANFQGSGEVAFSGPVDVTGHLMVGATPAATPVAGAASVAGALSAGSLVCGGAADITGRLMVGATPAATPVAGAANIAGAVKMGSSLDVTGRLMVGATPAATPVSGAGYLAGALALGSTISQPTDTQNGIGFESWDSTAVITTTNGTLWTVPASQTWAIKHVFCKITTNFDCTGDDCTLIIGNTEDTDGFLTLADAELQAADTEGTGFDAGWEGLVAATIGAFLDPEGLYVIDNTDTIDIDIKDTSDSSNPTAGAATCWLNYTRIQ